MKKFGFAFVGIFILVLASCYVPSPLYGTWADNDGNKIIFMTDGTFSATVKVSDSETPSISSGSYTVIDNTNMYMQQDNIFYWLGCQKCIFKCAENS